MVKFAIVGSSKAKETTNVMKTLHNIIGQFNPKHDIFVSGGAKGIDSIAEDIATRLGFKTEICYPAYEGWEAYKVRNMTISNISQYLYCVVLKGNDEFCYHCKSGTHNRSGGCWTYEYARRINHASVFRLEV